MTRRAWAIPLLLSLAGCSAGAPAGAPPRLGDPDRGRVAVGRNACGSCHQIPGVMWADGRAGPPLDKVARRTVIAGVLPNTRDQMVRWLRFPQEVVPGNAMPDMGLTEAEAHDIAAYLETLR